MRYIVEQSGSRWVVKDTTRNFRMVCYRVTEWAAKLAAKERNDRERVIREGAESAGIKLVKSDRSPREVLLERKAKGIP